MQPGEGVPPATATGVGVAAGVAVGVGVGVGVRRVCSAASVGVARARLALGGARIVTRGISVGGAVVTVGACGNAASRDEHQREQRKRQAARTRHA